MIPTGLRRFALATLLALGTGNAIEAGASALPGTGVVVATETAPAVFHLGPAPAIAARFRRVVVGRIVGMEPPAQGAVSVEVWLLSSPDGPAKFAGRFSPFPVVRVDPGSATQHQPFLVPVQTLVPPGGGGDWYVELRLSLDSGSTLPSTPSTRLQFSGIAFGTD